ncbi:MAG: DinB family protein [Bacteroidota bacterium]
MDHLSNVEVAIKRMEHLLTVIPAKLYAIHERDFVAKPAAAAWSKKEILGHLIDSAANNHQRFISTQYENVPSLSYDPDKWNALNFYQEADGKLVIDLWCHYNQHLLEVSRRIPAERLLNKCLAGGNEPVALAFLIVDYVEHLEHHLKQILEPDAFI